jgi:hypothetical protein
MAIILPFINYPTIVTGSRDDGALKVVKPFHLWILATSAILSISFHKIKSRGQEERYVTIISLFTTIFATINFFLHFLDGLALWMALTRSITDGLYFALAIISMFKVALQTVHARALSL